jgi:hypothetical protein
VSTHASKIASVSYNFVLPNLTNREGVVGVSLRDRAAMDESMKIRVFAGVVGLLVFVALYRYITQCRQLSSGRTIGQFFPQRSGGKFAFENLITITTAGKWCRLLFTLKSAEGDDNFL